MTRVTLLTAKPRAAATGAVSTVRMAGGGELRPYRYLGEHWLSGVASAPRFSAGIGFAKEGWTGGSVPTTGVIDFAPSTSAGLDELSALYWPDADVTVVTIEEDETGIVTELVGTIAGVSIGRGKLSFTLADLAYALGKPVVIDRFAGTGGIEGIEEAANRVKRRSWGAVFNVEGRLLDKANAIFEFGDPARPLQAIDKLRDQGSEGPVALLPWQGSINATLAALAAAAAPAGGGVVAPSIACAKWWQLPSGPLTADLRGETAGGYTDNPAEIAQRILAVGGSLSIVDLAAASLLRPYSCGLHMSSDSETAAQALDRLLLGVSLVWLLQPEGGIELLPFTWEGEAETIVSQEVTRVEVLPPMRARRIGYQRNERPLGDGEIAKVLSYEDGTPIDTLKPAGPGATAGTPAGSEILGRPVEEFVFDLNLNGANWFEMAETVEARQAVMLALNTLDGVPIGTVISEFRGEYQEGATAIAESFTLLGAKSDDGQAWNLSLDTVKVSPDQTLAQHFESISVEVAGKQAQINDLKSILVDEDGNVVAKAVLALDVNGRVAGMVLTNNGTLSSLEMMFDSYKLLGPNETVLIFAEDGRVKMPDVEVNTLMAKTVTITGINPGAVSGIASFTASDTQVATSETTIIQTPSFAIGDEEYGRAIAVISCTHDAQTVVDSGAIIRTYASYNEGGSWTLLRSHDQGIRTNGGDTQWSIPCSYSVGLASVTPVRLKVTAQSTPIGGGNNNPGSYIRQMQINVFRGQR
jgi:hypothetical protein